MQDNLKISSSGSKNIFLQTPFSLVLQFPFENTNAAASLKQQFAKRGLLFRKISKNELQRQLTKSNVDFVPTFGANFVLTSESTEITQWQEIVSLIQQYQAILLLMQHKEGKSKSIVWYNKERFLKKSTFTGQPPFSSQLLQILGKKTVIPLLANNMGLLLFLLEQKTKLTEISR